VRSKKLEKEKIFLLLLIFSALGLSIGTILKLSHLYWLGFFFFVIMLFYKRNILLALPVALIFIFSAHYAFNFTKNIASAKEVLFSQKPPISIYGKIITYPQETENSQKFVLSVEEVNQTKIKTKILVYFGKDKNFYKGEKIRILGKIKEPPSFEDFDYKNYLYRQGIVGVVYYPELKEVEEANFLYKIVNGARKKADKVFSEGLPYPENYFVKAVILGEKRELPEKLKEIFNKSGIRHITAISGMHIVVLLNILTSFLIALGLWRQQAGLLSLFFIVLYIFFIGFQPSAVRAAIMGAGVIIAQIFGRLPDTTRFLLLAAVAMLFTNPFLIYDIGFQLSFLAAAGINYLTPFFSQKLKRVPNVCGLRDVLSMSLGAQVFTIPLLLYHFEYFSFLSFLTNILVVPLMPLLLGLGILALIFGFISSWLSFVVFLPLFIISRYIIWVASTFSQFTNFILNIKISLALVIFYYLCLFVLVRKILTKQKYWFLKI